MKRILMGLCLALALGLGALIVFAPEIEVSMSETEIREKISAEIPKTVPHKAGTAEITALDLDLLETDQVAVALEMTVTALGMTADVAGETTTGLRYKDGDFYLADLVLDDLEITPREDTESLVGDLGKAASSAFRNMFSNDDVAGSDAAAARIEARLREAIGPAARNAADRILQSVPVYSLNGKDLKHDAAALALKDIRFSETAATAVLDPRQMVLKILAGVAIFAFALLGALGWMSTVAGSPIRN